SSSSGNAWVRGVSCWRIAAGGAGGRSLGRWWSEWETVGAGAAAWALDVAATATPSNAAAEEATRSGRTVRRLRPARKTRLMRPGREEGEDIRSSGLLTLPHFTPNEKNPRRTGDEPGGPEAEPPGAITLARSQYVNRTTSSTMRGAEKVFCTLPNVAGFEMSA